MKKIVFSLLIVAIAGIMSCRKTDTDPDIKQYDEDQIQAFIKTNGITGMQRDTSGIYYKILTPGTGTTLAYPDSLSFVYTLNTFDGKYKNVDTLNNHYCGFLGHLSAKGYPKALQTALFNLVKKNGTRVRFLVPSHLAYGPTGIGSGSSTNTDTRIDGNQCLDYYIHLMNNQPGDNQDTYDDLVIKNYLIAKSLTGYTKLPNTGVYYLITKPGVTNSVITDNTTISATYTFTLLNGYIFNENNTSSGVSLEIPDMIHGLREGIKSVGSSGAKITFLLPSGQAYGKTGIPSLSVPSNAVVRFDVQILNVTP